jgi:hypothetical protein
VLADDADNSAQSPSDGMIRQQGSPQSRYGRCIMSQAFTVLFEKLVIASRQPTS